MREEQKNEKTNPQNVNVYDAVVIRHVVLATGLRDELPEIPGVALLVRQWSSPG